MARRRSPTLIDINENQITPREIVLAEISRNEDLAKAAALRSDRRTYALIAAVLRDGLAARGGRG